MLTYDKIKEIFQAVDEGKEIECLSQNWFMWSSPDLDLNWITRFNDNEVRIKEKEIKEKQFKADNLPPICWINNIDLQCQVLIIGRDVYRNLILIKDSWINFNALTEQQLQNYRYSTDLKTWYPITNLFV